MAQNTEDVKELVEDVCPKTGEWTFRCVVGEWTLELRTSGPGLRLHLFFGSVQTRESHPGVWNYRCQSSERTSLVILTRRPSDGCVSLRMRRSWKGVDESDLHKRPPVLAAFPLLLQSS